jgi:predicted O-methyltransferase YrrM
MWKLKQATALLSYLLTARTPEQMHSPYLFDAMRYVFDAKRQYYAFREIEGIRHSLGKSPVQVSPNGLGAPSRKAFRRPRTVGDVISVSTSSAFKCQCLFRLALFLEAKTILEIGSAAGVSTAYLASTSANAIVHAFEGNPVLADHVERVARALELQNIRVHKGAFAQAVPAVLDEIKHFDLAFLDGNHRHKPTLTHFQLLKDRLSEDSVIVVDDIRWSEEMWRAWKELSADSAVTAALDIYSFGMLFFRPAFRDRVDLQIIPRRIPPRVILH